MFRQFAGAFALVSMVALSCGCATIVHGTTQRVQIDSVPPGADVAIDDSQHVTTPTAVSLSRAHPHALVFHKSGYRDATENLKSSTSGWILGNLIAGGVVGIAIDASDGAGRKLSADSLQVRLTPLPPSTVAPATAASQPQPVSPAEVHPATFMLGLRRAMQPDPGQPAVVPAGPEGPPPEGFTDE